DFPAAVEAAGRRDILFNITIDQLARLSAPTVLVFEDVHWADEATLDLIKFLGRRLHGLGVMLVISYRDDELGPKHPLRAVLGDLASSMVSRLHLVSLSAEAVTTLAEAAGRPVANLHRITCGNPFFVTEALAGPEESVPPTVRDAVIARLARLSDEARAIVDV